MANHYEVKDAANLSQGYELLHALTPDIIILDINLPDGNGAQHAMRFKTNQNLLILISADNEQLVNTYMQYKANAFIQKPFTAQELLDVINRLQ
jgi:DNA-binding response OmpR family regulator